MFFFSLSVDTSTKTVGCKEGSGFTHAYNDEPITFNPLEAHEGIRDVSGVIIELQSSQDNYCTVTATYFMFCLLEAELIIISLQ